MSKQLNPKKIMYRERCIGLSKQVLANFVILNQDSFLLKKCFESLPYIKSCNPSDVLN